MIKPPWDKIEKLSQKHVIESVDFGSLALNDWAQKARNEQNKGRIATRVLTSSSGEICGLFSMKMVPHSKNRDCAALIVWLGLSAPLQGKGYSTLLIKEIFEACLSVDSVIPFRYVVLDIDQEAHEGVEKIYARLGFSKTGDGSRMAIKMSTVRKIFSPVAK